MPILDNARRNQTDRKITLCLIYTNKQKVNSLIYYLKFASSPLETEGRRVYNSRVMKNREEASLDKEEEEREA